MRSAILRGPAPAELDDHSRENASDRSWTTERVALRAHKIPLLALLATVLALAVGELASGTGLYFVAMMAITLCCIGVTYNMLGGLSRISGFLFTAMAAATIVISQFAKVILFEPADKNLVAPDVTITVYAVFYFCAMLGVFVFGWIRLQLPKPLEPTTASQLKVLYFIALVVGILANAVFYVNTWGGYQSVTSYSHSIGLAFSPLILFSIVLAVDQRIRKTNGRHSLSVWVIVSALAIAFYQYLQTSRQGLATPVVVYLLACYVRGYRFRARHYIGMLIAVVLFVAVISPFEIYSRSLMSDNLSFRDRLAKAYSLLESPPSWQVISNVQADIETKSNYDEYYSQRGTFVLSRLSLIRADSDLIAACANGFHYGFKALKADLLTDVPRLLYPNKPNEDSGLYIQGVVGQGDQSDTSNKWDITSISDSFGAFGWAGTVLFPMLILPMIFVVYDSMFDLSRPWGTVALGMGVLGIWGHPMSGLLVLLVKDPVSLWFLSFLTVGIAGVLTRPSRFSAGNRGRRLGDYPPAKLIS
jgi:hypothetical protein